MEYLIILAVLFLEIILILMTFKNNNKNNR